MIRHKIRSVAGQANLPDGTPAFGGISVCGKRIVMLSPLTQGQEVVVGKEPHAHCPGCFGDEPADAGFSGALYDGVKVEGGAHLEDVTTRIVEEHDTSGLGALEEQ